MLEGLPPNNAAHRLRSSRRRAAGARRRRPDRRELRAGRGRVDRVRDRGAWPGGGKAWLVEAYFGFAPDEDVLRALIAAAADDETRRGANSALTEKRDWVANSLAGLEPGARRTLLVHGAHDRDKLGPSDVGVEIEAGLAFGTGHHGTTRGCLLHLDRLLKRRRPAHVLDVGCGAGVLAIAAAKVAPAEGLARRHRSRGGRGRQRQRPRSTASARSAEAVVSRGVENRALRAAAPYDLVFANILAKPLRLLAPSLVAIAAPTATPSSPASCLPTFPVCSRRGGRKDFTSPSASTSKAGRA